MADQALRAIFNISSGGSKIVSLHFLDESRIDTDTISPCSDWYGFFLFSAPQRATNLFFFCHLHFVISLHV